MSNILRVLIIEDVEDDALLLLRELKRSNYEPVYQRVQTRAELETALAGQDWDIVLSDYSMPQFSGLQALNLLKTSGLDIPFILVSGTVGESLAVEAMKAGASDYLLKDKLARLGPAVERELREAEVRRARKRAETGLQKLNEELESKVIERTAQLTALNQQLREEISERTRIERALQLQAEQQAGVAMLGQHALENMELSSLMEKAVNLVAKNLGVEYSAILEILPDGETLLMRAGAGSIVGMEGRLKGRIQYDAYSSHTILDLELVLIENPQTKTRYTASDFLRRNGLNSSLTLLIGADPAATQPFGLLGAYSKDARQFSRHEINFMQAVANVLATTIERREAEEETRKALEKEKELNELKSRFVSMVSHEFRTPLTSILSSAEFLKFYADRMTEAKKFEHLERIQISVKNMTLLLNDILTFGKADAGKMDCKPAALNLLHFCQSLVEEFQLNTGSSHVINFVPQDCPHLASSLVDESLLRQILSNLLTNAIKYSPNGGEVRFELLCRSEEAIFKVQDQGTGIPEKDFPRLFEPFHRASNVGNIQGTGLGLAIVKKCVETHGGAISFDSKVGVGTTFQVTIPIS